MGKLVAAYYRSSSNIQENSVDIQTKMAIKKAVELGINIDLPFTDQYVSARKLKLMERPEMKKMIDYMMAKTVGRILIYKRDRIARRADDYLQFYYLCKEYDIEVIFTSKYEKAMTYDYMGEFFEHIMAGFVELEGDNIHERHLQAQITKFQNDNLWSVQPYGYYMDKNKKIWPEPKKLEQCEIIFREVLNQNHHTLNDLCKYINDELKWRRDYVHGKKIGESRPWTVSDLETILRHPLYTGDRVMNIGEKDHMLSLEGIAIIDSNSWLEAQEIVDVMRQSRGKYKPSQAYLLSGLIYCSTCEKPLYDRIKEKSEIYVCRQHKNVVFSRFQIDSLVLEQTRMYVKNLLKNHWKKLIVDKLRTQTIKAGTMISTKKLSVRFACENVFDTIDDWIKEPNAEYQKKLETNMINAYETIHSLEEDLHAVQAEESRHIRQLSDAPYVVDQINDDDIYQYLLKTSDQKLRNLILDVVHKIIVDKDQVKEIVFKSPYVVPIEKIDERIAIPCI